MFINSFQRSLKRIEDDVEQIFTPASPVKDSKYLQGREDIIERVQRAIRSKGTSIVMYGYRGVGKTSVAKIASKNVNPDYYHHSVSKNESLRDIGISILRHFGVNFIESENGFSGTERQTFEIGITGAKLTINKDKTDSGKNIEMKKEDLTPQQIARLLPDYSTIIVLDDFERIEDSIIKSDFADLIKKISDNEKPCTLILVGVAEDVEQLIESHESIERKLLQIYIPKLSDDDIKKIVHTGMNSLEITISDEIVDKIRELSLNFPYYTHRLCEYCVHEMLEDLKNNRRKIFSITKSNLEKSIKSMIGNMNKSVSSKFEKILGGINSSSRNRCRYILYAIADYPEDYVESRYIYDWVKIKEKSPKNVRSNALLEQLCTSGIIKKDSLDRYSFTDPIMRTYVKLKLHDDTPDNELASISAQIREVGNRMSRFERLNGSD